MSEVAPQVALIGAGSVGTTLARALEASGCAIVGVYSRTRASAVRLAEQLAGSPPTCEHLEDLGARSDLVLLTVSDAAIAPLAHQLAAAGAARPGRLFCHTSGFHTCEPLAPLRARGALVAATHPLLTFADPERAFERLAGAAFTVQGESAARSAARRWIELLGARAYEVAAGGKALVHCAAVFACNYVVTLFGAAERCLEQSAGAGESLPLSALFPLLETTLENLRGARRSHQALSGPLERGELEVLRGHLETLDAAGCSGDGELYRALARATLELVAARGELAEERLRELRALLDAEPER